MAQRFLENAQQELASAEYLLNVTMRSIRDPKLLINILLHVYKALEAGVDGVLASEQERGKVTGQLLLFEEKLKVCVKLMGREGRGSSYGEFLGKIHRLVIAHQKSPMEFSRGNTYVIADREYHLEPLTTRRVQEYIQEARGFINAFLVIINRKT